MKIAICFSGELRTALHAAPAIQAWIGSLWSNCDFFIHTWDRNTYKPGQPYLRENIRSLVNRSISHADRNRYIIRELEPWVIEQIRSFYQPKELVVEDYNLIRSSVDPSLPWNPLYYSFARSQELRAGTDQHYDLVVKLRPDTSYPIRSVDQGPILKQRILPSSLAQLVDHCRDSETLYSLSDNQVQVDDIMWAGSGRVMDLASAYAEHCLEPTSLNFYQFCSEQGVSIGQLPQILYAIHRPAVLSLDSLDWVSIYLVMTLLDNYDFSTQLDELEPFWQTRLAQCLIKGQVLNQYCELFDLAHS